MSATSDSKPLALAVRPRGKPIARLPDETYAEPSDSGHDVYIRIAAKSRLSPHRLRITKASDGSLVPDRADTSIDSLGLYDQSSVFVKDLGPQIAWRTVFIIEYLGPLLIHPLVYYLRPYIYRSPHTVTRWTPYPAPTLSQTLSLAFIVLHFFKREMETILVHRFSAATMPAFNIFKNSAHYWILGGLNIALFTYSPSQGCATAHAPPRMFASLFPFYDGRAFLPALATILFVVGELGNLSAHLTLRSLRKDGSGERGIPRSGVFKLLPNVTCPNYTFETLAWIGIGLMNRSWSTALFAVVAVAQMAVWSKKKESRYRKEFGKDKYKFKAWGMLPGIV